MICRNELTGNAEPPGSLSWLRPPRKPSSPGFSFRMCKFSTCRPGKDAILFLEHPIAGCVIPLAQTLFNILEEINFSVSQTLQFISQLIFILFIFACLSFWTSQTNIKLSNLWAMPDVSLGLVKEHGGGVDKKVWSWLQPVHQHALWPWVSHLASLKRASYPQNECPF